MLRNLLYLLIAFINIFSVASQSEKHTSYNYQKSIEEYKSSYLQKIFKELEQFSAEELLAMEEAISCEDLKKQLRFKFLKEAADILNDADFILLLERIKDIVDYRQKNLSSETIFPLYWEPQSNNIHLFKLNPKSNEFQFLKERINKDGNKRSIKSILRL